MNSSLLTAAVALWRLPATRQFVRFCTVSAFVNAGLFVMYLAIVYAGVDPKISAAITFILGVLVGFLSHRRWSFRSTSDPRRGLIRYGVVYGGCLAFNISCLYLFVDLLHLRHEFVQAAIIVENAAMLYFLQVFWIFAPPRGACRPHA